jgi:hypothetical protein
VDLPVPNGSFTAKLLARASYTMTPLMFASALIQFNSSTQPFNERSPGAGNIGRERTVRSSTSERDTLAPNFPATRTGR